uniref:Uncharacterized protein n=1 Tax=Opuntia streptacantha TaxID=393608 RepID=A0A7C8ZLX6_OPUST
MLEIKCIMSSVRLLHLLTSPANKHLMIHIGLYCQTCREINRNLQIHPFPVIFEQNAQFLSPSKSKRWNKHLPPTSNTFVYSFEKLSFTSILGITYCCCIC